MAEFCKQCAKELGFDNDFEGLQTEAQTKQGFTTQVLCEECGGRCWVDHTGKCVSNGCYEFHGIDTVEEGDELIEDLEKQLDKLRQKVKVLENA